MNPRRIRWLVQAVFVMGIVAMIVSFVRGESGVAVGFGIVAALAAMALIIVTAVAGEHGFALGTVDEARAEALESEITALVEAGAAETAVRGLVRRAIELGRLAGPPPRSP